MASILLHIMALHLRHDALCRLTHLLSPQVDFKTKTVKWGKGPSSVISVVTGPCVLAGIMSAASDLLHRYTMD